MDWFIGMLFSTVMATAAYWQHSLSKSGLIGAIIVGTCIVGGVGWWGMLVLAFFFVSSSLISKFSPTKDIPIKEEIAAKGGRRDLVQVLANGGVAALASIGYASTGHTLWIIMFSASLAAATSDTWASEIGKWSKQAPRDCLTWKIVVPGTSGAISLLGTAASIVGALLIALLSLPLIAKEEISLSFEASMICIIALAGWLGNWLDTIIGAKYQIRYQCKYCGRQTERVIHCAVSTQPIQGVPWVNNDVVNLICTGSAAIMAMLIFFLLGF